MNNRFGQRSPRMAIAFHGMVLLCSLMLLSMPVLPTTDGPIHRYYVGVLHDVVSHNGSVYDLAYTLRHPFPPYAMQYVVELGLARFMDLQMAEKIFATLTLLVTAYGFRSASRALGRNGDAVALGVSCLLLPWSLWMGFFNYTMAVGLSLVALSLWLHARAGQKKLWWCFAVVCLLLVLTHPVPLLVLLGALLLDLLVTVFQKGGGRPRWDAVAAFAFGVALALYPLFVGTSHAAGGLQDYGFHLKRVVRQVLLFGLSPYAVHSFGLVPNLYRLSLYAVAAVAAYLSWTAWKRALATSSVGFVNLLLPAGVGLGLAILVLPDGVSGSFFFSTRMITFVWIALLLSASDADFPTHNARRLWLGATAGMAIVVLLSALMLIRPVATQLAALDAEIVPAGGAGLVIDPSQVLATKVRSSFEFDPYHWAGVIPLIRAHQLMLNSPWLEQAILPIAFRQNSPVLNAVATPQDAKAINQHDGTVEWLTPESLGRVLHNTSVIFNRIPLQGTSLSDQIGSTNAAQFDCVSHGWYKKCVRRRREQ